MSKQCIAGLLIFIWLGQDLGLARQKPEAIKATPARLRWSELAPVVVDRKVGTTLPDGTRIEGQVLAVRPESLVMDIAKTSNRKVHPKGQTEIPRGSVTEVRIINDRGPFKLVGGIVGTVGGLFGAVALAFYGNGAGAVPGFLVVLPVAAVGGYYAGKAADRRVTRIVIAPDRPSTLSGEEAQQ